MPHAALMGMFRFADMPHNTSDVKYSKRFHTHTFVVLLTYRLVYMYNTARHAIDGAVPPPRLEQTADAGNDAAAS